MFDNVLQCLIVFDSHLNNKYFNISTCIFQVAEVKEELKIIYSCEEAEASTIYNLLMMNLELYNQKLKTLEKTRDLIEQMTPADEFNEWDGMYTARKMLDLNIIEPHVSIIRYI